MELIKILLFIILLLQIIIIYIGITRREIEQNAFNKWEEERKKSWDEWQKEKEESKSEYDDERMKYRKEWEADRAINVQERKEWNLIKERLVKFLEKAEKQR